MQKTKEERIVQRENFEFRVKLMRRQGQWRSGISSSVDWWRRRKLPQLFCREFQSTGAWWVKDLSVTLKRERTEGRWRVMMLEEWVCPVRLNIEKAVDIRRLFWLKNHVSYRSDFIWMRCSILSQWRDLRTGVMWANFGVLETARAEEFRMNWTRSN